MLYRGGNGDLGVVGGGRWRVYVRPCCIPSAVCVCVCDLGVREVSPLAVCLGRPTSLPPACALSWLLEMMMILLLFLQKQNLVFQRVHRHRYPCLLGLAYFKRNCNDDVTQQICRDLRSAKRAACVSSEFLEFAGCRSAKRARTCVDRERLVLEKEGRGWNKVLRQVHPETG